MPAPLDPRDHLVPRDLRVPLVFLDLKALVVLKDLLVPPVSLVLLEELDPLAPTVILAPPVLPVPLVKTAPRV